MRTELGENVMTDMLILSSGRGSETLKLVGTVCPTKSRYGLNSHIRTVSGKHTRFFRTRQSESCCQLHSNKNTHFNKKRKWQGITTVHDYLHLTIIHSGIFSIKTKNKKLDKFRASCIYLVSNLQKHIYEYTDLKLSKSSGQKQVKKMLVNSPKVVSSD